MEAYNTAEWNNLTPEEKKRKLYEKQKALLYTFLEHHAITQAQYDKSLGDLTEKMGVSKFIPLFEKSLSLGAISPPLTVILHS